MPDFTTIDHGRAWSGVSRRNTSQRVGYDSNVRPKAEVKLASRKIEIRTGARVQRARGKWVTFKRGLTKLRSGLRMLGADQRKMREARHGEYRFDRHVNRLVEGLANKPGLDPTRVHQRLDELAKQADRIKANDSSVTDRMLARRFERNLRESLDAVARTKPEALPRILAAFRPGGPMHKLGVSYAVYNDPDSKRLLAMDRDDPHGLTPEDYVRGGIFDPPHKTVGDAISTLAGVPHDIPGLARRAADDAIQDIVTRVLPREQDLDGLAGELSFDPLKLRGPQRAYIEQTLEAFVSATRKNGANIDRQAVRRQLELALAGIEIGLPELASDTAKRTPSRSSEAFPTGLGMALSGGQTDLKSEIDAVQKHLGGISGVTWPSLDENPPGPYRNSSLCNRLDQLKNSNPLDRARHEEALEKALGEVKSRLWKEPDGKESASLSRLRSELVIALSRVRLQGLGPGTRDAKSADERYESPLYDSDSVRQLIERDRIGDGGRFRNPFRGMPVSEFWKLFVDREYQNKIDSSWNTAAPYYEAVFDRGDKAEPGYMRGMVEAMNKEVCPNLGKRMTSSDIERLHDTAVKYESRERMLTGFRHKMIASYGVNKWSKRGIEELERRVAGHVGKTLDKNEKNKLSRLSDEERLEELKRMNRQELTDNKPSGMQTWGFMGDRHGDPHAYFWPKESHQSAAATDQALNTYYDEIGRASNDKDRLRAIVKCCQTLHQQHVFRDGNARTMGMLLLNRLLMEQGMSPAILQDPKAFKGLSVDEMIDEIEQGQLLFKTVKSGADMRPRRHIENPKEFMGGDSEL